VRDVTPSVPRLPPTPVRVAGRRRTLQAVVASELISASGSQMTWLALPWFALTTSGSPAHAATVLIAQTLPIAIFGVLAGPVVARLGIRRTLMFSDAVRAPLIAAIPFAHALGWLTYPLLLLLVFTAGVFYVPYYAAQRLALSEYESVDERRLAGANALLQAATRLPALIGSVVGGALIALLGAIPVLYVDAATFLLSSLLVAVFVPAVPTRAPIAPSRRIRPAALVRDRFLLTVTLSGMVVETVFQALVVALPVLVIRRQLGGIWLVGLLVGAWGAGALIGCLGAPVALRWISNRGLATYGAVVHCVPLWSLLLPVGPAVLVLAVAVSGLANEVALASRTTLVTLSVPEAERPNALSMYVTLTQSAGLPGLMLAGAALGAVGTGPVFAVIAGMSSLAAAGMFSLRGPSRTVHPARREREAT
jgi:MFS family permease